MSLEGPNVEPAKTECPFCGNVWQDHTLSQAAACTAIMKEQYSRAVSRDTNSKTNLLLNRVSTCPVCGEAFGEHTDADLNTCAGKLRKRERGASGLEFQSDIVEGHCKNEEPDPVKRGKLRAQMLKGLCSCGKTLGEHTQGEILACVRKQRT